MSKVMRTHTGITEWNGDFWCDSCGKRVRGMTTVNGMDFCAKCYQETFGETDKDKQIAELQKQTEEKDKENATLEAMLAENANDRKAMQEFKIGEDEYDLTDEDARNSLCWEVKELKQQLAIIEKALELACEHIKEDLKCDDTQDDIYNYFKTQAKEMLKNE